VHGWTLVFDLDGTLIDTAPDLIRAANHVLARAGVEPVGDDVLRPVISFGSRFMIDTGLQHRGQAVDEDRLDAMWRDMLAYYEENIAVHSQPFPGMREALTRFRNAGAVLAVCTNKKEHLARKLLQALGLADPFSAITGVDTLPVYKPDPAHLLGAIEMAGGAPDRSVMIGDSDVDVQTAKAADIPVVGVTFGYTDRPMRELGAHATIDHYDELPIVLARVTGDYSVSVC
jgi:phosphoglycolate phosphatase